MKEITAYEVDGVLYANKRVAEIEEQKGAFRVLQSNVDFYARSLGGATDPSEVKANIVDCFNEYIKQYGDINPYAAEAQEQQERVDGAVNAIIDAIKQIPDTCS